MESWEREGRLYGLVIYFTGSFAEFNTVHSSIHSEFPFFTYEGDVLLSLDENQGEQLKQYAEEMIGEIYSDKPDKLPMIRKLLAVYLQKVRRLYISKFGKQTSESNTNQYLFNRFRKTIDDYFHVLESEKATVLPSVSLISKMLNVSPNYLNEIVKGVSGETASTHLQRKMIMEIKSYLIHTDLQAAEIANRFGFESVPYFNRFFKKHAQCTPVAFRKKYKAA